MAAHALLNAFKAKTPAFGAWIMLPGAFNARTVAQSSPHLSWVVIDCEHGLTSLHPGAAESVQAISSLGPDAPSALIRIPATGASTGTGWQIKYALDAGARGVIVPMVGTADKAREIVADSRFPPAGRRGLGSPFAPSAWGLSASDYLRAANDAVLVIVQIETREAVENISDIAKVDGVDVLFIGPYDLSVALGYETPSPDPHPDVERVIQLVRTTAAHAGKKCAIFCTSGEQANKRAREGFDMIAVTADAAALSENISKHLAAAVSQ
ncbi:Phosphoenolpyruvate/pyruvate domain-containing protein [Auriscalpium vulgare]|uniref:Phosphoenolpyruvate/pyruvate domain-containing protein n=1 Tax=Auriscalpium vulgare TaxID=40419 RepID=A0ACB8RKZ9_9AGAM|nr:Phosphoenolpyruvate/pyruvate domain-containing protein [Auriscalpium vulgare]